MDEQRRLAKEHYDVTRRYFLQRSAVGLAALGVAQLWAERASADESERLLQDAISKLEYLTREEDFRTYGRGKPPPYKLPPEKLREVGLVRETWQLEVVADPDSDAKVEQPLSKEAGTAMDWGGLMDLAEKCAVRFMAVMTCTNGKQPCGMGLWEGVPLKEVIWLTRPKSNVRRVFYYGYHNDDPEQTFRSSLPVGRVLEEPPGEQPVVLCYKLNGQWLSSKEGGPVRMLVPGQYGNKSVKWLQHIVLTNNYQANDTYATWNNDTVSHIKTCARFIYTPKSMTPGQRAAITGVAQVGMSGLSKVQYWLHRQGEVLPENDEYFAKAKWKDADILPPPKRWGGGLPAGRLPAVPSQIDSATGKPYTWPMRNAFAHWATLIRVERPGTYELRCRTIDANGVAQPMPRPFLKSGYNAIQMVKIVAK